jgi:hypothetical protein
VRNVQDGGLGPPGSRWWSVSRDSRYPHLHDCSVGGAGSTSGVDGRAANPPVLPLIPGVVQGVEHGDRWRQHLHVLAGGPDDLFEATKLTGECPPSRRQRHYYVDAYPNISADLLGCCTEVTACMRTKSGMIVIRSAAWRPLLRASSWVSSANFACTAFSEVGVRSVGCSAAFPPLGL